MTATAIWRPMTADDLDGVVEVARLAFPDHFEDRACFENRLELYPAGCFSLDEGGAIIGYLVAYPWLRDQAPALNTLAERLPADADVLYLHDLALHPGARGRGLTSPVIEQVVRLAQTEGLPAVSLVAVNDATAFWRLRGFEDAPSPTMATKLASYGSDAAYMIRSLV